MIQEHLWGGLPSSNVYILSLFYYMDVNLGNHKCLLIEFENYCGNLVVKDCVMSLNKMRGDETTRIYCTLQPATDRYPSHQ